MCTPLEPQANFEGVKGGAAENGPFRGGGFWGHFEVVLGHLFVSKSDFGIIVELLWVGSHCGSFSKHIHFPNRF